MGCDVRAVVEVRARGERAWHCRGLVEIHRNYGVFAMLAGVRGGAGRAIALPRGLPDDLSIWAREFFEEDCSLWRLHDVSWLSLGELRAAAWSGVPGGLEFARGVLPYLEYQMEPGAGVEDVRLVFWFEN